MHGPKGIFVTHTFKYSVRLIDLITEHCIGSTGVACCKSFYAGFWRKDRLSFFEPFLPTLHHWCTAFSLDDRDGRNPVDQAKAFQFLKTFIDSQWTHSAAYG